MKKVLSLFLAVVLMSTMVFSVSAADTVTAAGFYNIGTKEGVTIIPAASEGTVEEVMVDIDGDGSFEKLFNNSDKLSVTYTDAVVNEYYGVILVEGTELPTKDNAIFYIDQLTAKSGILDVGVYPILPDKKTEPTLYISCSDETKGLVSVVLNYTPEGTIATEPEEVPEYTLGDVNADGLWNSTDALMALKIGANLLPDATKAEKLAADVNNDKEWTIADALKILQYGAGLITSWE